MRKDAVEMNLSTVLQSISQFSFSISRKKVPFKLPIYRYPIFIRIGDLLHRSRNFILKEMRRRISSDDLWGLKKRNLFRDATHRS